MVSIPRKNSWSSGTRGEKPWAFYLPLRSGIPSFFQIKRSSIRKGMVMVSPRLNPQASWEFEAEILVLHHPTTISPRYQAMGRCLRALPAEALCSSSPSKVLQLPKPRAFSCSRESGLPLLPVSCRFYSVLQTLTKCRLCQALETQSCPQNLTFIPSANISKILLCSMWYC